MYEGVPSQGRLQSRIVELLRRRVTIPGQVIAASYEELAAELGVGFTARDVQVALAELQRSSYFTGRSHLSEREFRVRLAW
jgi:hypothetical protein